ncbi:MAG: GFA family protein [Polyangiaceae bacterium]|nr:GFA family protein [Polyangiaceae bacterium]MCB9608756.1 GFA family protein [Polyangiaceae bacterium]
MIDGRCCCGAVRFQLKRPPKLMGTCHCSRCRRLGIATFAFVRREDFAFVSGEASVEVYAPEAPYRYTRSFCRRCGTALGELIGDAETFPVNVNCLENPPALSNAFHEFVADKPGWYEIADAAPQFPGHPELADG